jgi:4'-phosphopantetheinyl transferase EntD
MARIPLETNYALELRGYRQPQFVAGRIALRDACARLGAAAPHAILPDDRGAPRMPAGVVASVSHKRTMAVALATKDWDGTLGVDIEALAPARLAIWRHVLTDDEQDTLAPFDDDRRWRELILRFSIKEAIYKALDPYLRRYIAFREVEVTPDARGGAEVKLGLKGGEGPFVVEARHQMMGEWLLTSVRARRG